MLTLSFDFVGRDALLVSIITKKALSAKKAQGYKFIREKSVDLSKANEASVRAKKEKARNYPNNKIIWGVIGMGVVPTAEETQRNVGAA